eukprot:jgi/Undpi1/1258/HiC_scaffold_109.g14172.m1
MRTDSLITAVSLLGLRSVSAWEVELKELVNPSLARVYDTPTDGRDESCAPDGCIGVLTRDESRSTGSRYGCTQQSGSSGACTARYRLNEEKYSGGTPQTISSVYVAFTSDSETTLQVVLEDDVVVDSWTGDAGDTGLQEIPGVSGYSVDEMELVAVIDEGSYMGITEVEIYVDVDDVPVTGISASERVSLTVSATVNDDSAEDTLDGSTSTSSSWSCSDGDECEITYDLLEVQSTEQLRIAFVDESWTEGATFNVYTAGVDGIFSSALSEVAAGPRDSSIEGLQTFGGIRTLSRYVKIEGVPASGGQFSISEVEIRLNENAPSYPSTVDSSLVPVGKTPLGSNAATSSSVPYDPRPSSEGGCSAGHFEGCRIYNIKDGDNSEDSRWSCSPKVDQRHSDVCHAQFFLNTQRYLRQIQIAFHKGDERHNEFIVYEAIPSAISSGDTTDFQTWDLSVWTNSIQIQPKLAKVADWFSIKEVTDFAVPYCAFRLPHSPRGQRRGIMPLFFFFFFWFVDGEGRIYMAGDDQTARIWAIEMMFPSDKTFTFQVRYYDDETLITTSFTSAGGDETWETFVLPNEVLRNYVDIIAVEGPDEDDYPTLRVNDCRILGEMDTAGSSWVVSTTLEGWYVIPDYIGDGSGDQEEIMEAICDGIGESFDGTDCDGVATGNDEALEVILVEGDYYLDGPVFLKSGISLVGESGEGSPYNTELNLHGSGTGADGVINADSIEGAVVQDITVRSNLDSAGATGTVGNVCFDVKNSQDITIDEFAGEGCPIASTRFVDTDGIIGDLFYGGGTSEGPEVTLEGVTDFTLTESSLEGVTITDSTNVSFEGDYDDGDLYGSIDAPNRGDQSANLVVTGTTSGVILRDITIGSGAEPRIVLENSNPFTIDGVPIEGGSTGDCIIKIPEGSDGDAILIQLNVETELTLEDDCFVLA